MKSLDIEVKLLGTKKTNYRVFRIPENKTFEDFHTYIMDTFGFYGGHLWNFHYGERGREVEISTLFEDIEPVFSTHIQASKTTIQEIFLHRDVKKLMYQYDYGDDWRFSVKLLKVNDEMGEQTKVIKTKGPVLLEDCGGIHRFYEILKDYEKGIFDENQFEDWDDFECLIEDSLKDYKISEFNI